MSSRAVDGRRAALVRRGRLQIASGCVAAFPDVLIEEGLARIVEASMNPAALFAMLAAVNNGWAFAAFVILMGVTLYLGRRDRP